MAEKIASGSWHEGPPGAPGPGGDQAGGGPDRAEVERLTAKRDNARWSAVVGFGMMFGLYFHSGFAIGGMLMVAYGITSSFYWSRRLRKAKGDPWAYDPDLDGPQAPDWGKT